MSTFSTIGFFGLGLLGVACFFLGVCLRLTGEGSGEGTASKNDESRPSKRPLRNAASTLVWLDEYRIWAECTNLRQQWVSQTFVHSEGRAWVKEGWWLDRVTDASSSHSVTLSWPQPPKYSISWVVEMLEVWGPNTRRYYKCVIHWKNPTTPLPAPPYSNLRKSASNLQPNSHIIPSGIKCPQSTACPFTSCSQILPHSMIGSNVPITPFDPHKQRTGQVILDLSDLSSL